MTRETWTAVDEYIEGLLIPTDTALSGALAASAAASLPAIQVTATQGKLLMLLARIAGARSILELGTLGGYSTIWLARALPEGGRVTTLELSERHAEVAASNITAAGLSGRVEIRVGSALESMREMVEEGRQPFDLIFIDADKPAYPAYLRASLALSRPGTVILADNVVRNGAIVAPEAGDANADGARRFFDLVAGEPRLTATAIQTVGSKGYDGFALAIVDAGL